MTWLEPMWLAYPTAAFLLLTLLFAWSVRWWLRAFPVPVLNYAYERKYEKPRAYVARGWDTGISMATATSAYAVVPMMTREQIMRKRAVEDAMYGFLPEVGS